MSRNLRSSYSDEFWAKTEHYIFIALCIYHTVICIVYNNFVWVHLLHKYNNTNLITSRYIINAKQIFQEYRNMSNMIAS